MTEKALQEAIIQAAGYLGYRRNGHDTQANRYS